ncbi:hypothetical protein KSP39_PZI004951 [Platanthera zijinensis]|uniref:Retrotransposon gag domain-containing protein n=1 Tax=Platanthera zijinensis TaxID=2320716 RepID=A0AAP0GBH8_9ASPA
MARDVNVTRGKSFMTGCRSPPPPPSSVGAFRNEMNRKFDNLEDLIAQLSGQFPTSPLEAPRQPHQRDGNSKSTRIVSAPYNGLGGPHAFLSWVVELESYFERALVPDHSQACVASIQLTGLAWRFWNSAKRRYAPDVSWTIMKSLLTHQYAPAELLDVVTPLRQGTRPFPVYESSPICTVSQANVTCESSGVSDLSSIMCSTPTTPVVSPESLPGPSVLAVDPPEPATEGEVELTVDCSDAEELGYPSDLDEDFSFEEVSPGIIPLPLDHISDLSPLTVIEPSVNIDLGDISTVLEESPLDEGVIWEDLSYERSEDRSLILLPLLETQAILESPQDWICPTLLPDFDDVPTSWEDLAVESKVLLEDLGRSVLDESPSKGNLFLEDISAKYPSDAFLVLSPSPDGQIDLDSLSGSDIPISEHVSGTHLSIASSMLVDYPSKGDRLLDDVIVAGPGMLLVMQSPLLVLKNDFDFHPGSILPPLPPDPLTRFVDLFGYESILPGPCRSILSTILAPPLGVSRGISVSKLVESPGNECVAEIELGDDTFLEFDSTRPKDFSLMISPWYDDPFELNPLVTLTQVVDLLGHVLGPSSLGYFDASNSMVGDVRISLVFLYVCRVPVPPDLLTLVYTLVSRLVAHGFTPHGYSLRMRTFKIFIVLNVFCTLCASLFRRAPRHIAHGFTPHVHYFLKRILQLFFNLNAFYLLDASAYRRASHSYVDDLDLADLTPEGMPSGALEILTNQVNPLRIFLEVGDLASLVVFFTDWGIAPVFIVSHFTIHAYMPLDMSTFPFLFSTVSSIGMGGESFPGSFSFLVSIGGMLVDVVEALFPFLANAFMRSPQDHLLPCRFFFPVDAIPGVYTQVYSSVMSNFERGRIDGADYPRRVDLERPPLDDFGDPVLVDVDPLPDDYGEPDMIVANVRRHIEFDDYDDRCRKLEGWDLAITAPQHPPSSPRRNIQLPSPRRDIHRHCRVKSSSATTQEITIIVV